MPRPSLELFAEVTTASGARYRWDANQAPGSRLQNFSFRTKLGEGFSDAGGTLSRRIDFDYPDLNLVDTITVVGGDGSVAYEGRLMAQPLTLDDKHSVGVTLAGWISHAKGKKFSYPYVDRDLGAWGPMSLGRRIANLTASYSPVDPESYTDPTDSSAGVATAITGAWVAPYKPVSEAWYDAGPGNTIEKIAYSWQREGGNIGAGDTNWNWLVIASSDDKATASVNGGNLRAAGPGSGLYLPAVPYRYACLQSRYEATPSGADSARYSIAWSKLAVYGNHGLALHTGQPGEPAGVFASDVMRHIAAQYCPLLDLSGVQETSYVIQHLTFRERTYPYDAFLEVNKYHQWHLGVWENKVLHFRPYDFTDYDWEVRTDDPGTGFSAQGPTTEDTYNGVVVTYKDLLTGVNDVITPDGNSELKDTDPNNVWNQHGEDHWKEDVALSTPSLAADAVQLGKMALAEANRPKAAGQIKVTGYIRDRQGNEQPVWKVRAGDMIAATNFFSGIHLIHETDYNDEDKTLTISVDAPSSALEAYNDRVANALQARNLT